MWNFDLKLPSVLRRRTSPACVLDIHYVLLNSESGEKETNKKTNAGSIYSFLFYTEPALHQTQGTSQSCESLDTKVEKLNMRAKWSST